jgi:hypothetical protein
MAFSYGHRSFGVKAWLGKLGCNETTFAVIGAQHPAYFVKELA